jgi:hypothetical protein
MVVPFLTKLIVTNLTENPSQLSPTNAAHPQLGIGLGFFSGMHRWE